MKYCKTGKTFKKSLSCFLALILVIQMILSGYTMEGYAKAMEESVQDAIPEKVTRTTTKIAEVEQNQKDETVVKSRGSIVKYKNGQIELKKESETMTSLSLTRNHEIAYVEPNYELYVQNTPNDPQYDDGLGNGQWAFPEIEITDAWGEMQSHLKGTTPKTVKVAVLDTGVDDEHEDLKGRITTGINLITDAPDPDHYEDNARDGHGTHVTGIIAATTNNGIGVAGVCGEFPIEIMPVKVLDSAGVGSVYDIAQGIRWAADHGANVINLSMGARLPDYPRTLADAVEYANSKGALIVAASGNEGREVKGFYPASLPGVISVGASAQDHTEPYFSNRNSNILAPGVDILSTLPGNQYGPRTGTSMAAPHVAGVAALLMSAFDTYEMPEINQLISGAKKKFVVNYTWYFILNTLMAVDSAVNGEEPAYDLEFTNVKRNMRLSGNVGVGVRINNPKNVELIELCILDEKGKQKHAESVPAAMNQYEYTFDVDTTMLDDGVYVFEALAYGRSKTGNILAQRQVENIMIQNENAENLVVEVIKPDGSMASGAKVEIYYAMNEEGNEKPLFTRVYSSNADMNGKVVIPNTVATQGNEFIMTAQGSNPDFFYYKTVRVPTHITMDSTDAVKVDVEGYRTDGVPLGGAKFSLDLLDSNFGFQNTNEKAFLMNLDISKLNEAGNTSVTLTAGAYNFKLTSSYDGYFLSKMGQTISDDAVIAFNPTSQEIAEIEFLPEDGFVENRMTLNLDEYTQTELKIEQKGGKLYVSPGKYHADLRGIKSLNTSYWRYDFKAPMIEVQGGQKKQIQMGGEITASLKLSSVYDENTVFYSGDNVNFEVDILDAYGNQMFVLMKSENDINKGYQYVLGSLKIYDEQDVLVDSSSGAGKSISWTIREDRVSGRYRAKLDIDGGPLAHGGSGGQIETEDVFVDVQQKDSIHLKIYNHSGNPAENHTAIIFEKENGSYKPITNRWSGETNTEGEVTLKASLDENKEYVAAVYRKFSATTDDADAMCVVVPIDIQNGQRSFTIDTAAMDLKEVVIKPLNVYEKEFEGLTYYYLYCYDEDGDRIPVTLFDGWDKKDMKILLPNHQKYQITFMSESYYLMEEISLPEDVQQSNEIIIGGQNITPLDIVYPSDQVNQWGDYEYTTQSLMLYREGMTETISLPEVRKPRVYVNHGTYRAVALVRHDDKMDLRYYFMDTVAYNMTLLPGKSFEWKLGDEFIGSVSTDKTSLLPGETFETEHIVIDHYGNYLRAARVYAFGSGMGEMSVADMIKSQNHDELAPFYIIKDANGKEIYQYKDTGRDASLLKELMETSYWSTSTSVRIPYGEGTYSSGRYPIPLTMTDGEYEAVLYIGIGKGEAYTGKQTFQVQNTFVNIDPMESYTKEEQISISGSTQPNCDVEIRYSVDGGLEQVAGNVLSDDTGLFEFLNFQTTREGEYRFTAVATLNGKVTVSEVVSTLVDRTAPANPQNFSGEGQDQSHILLSWNPSLDADVEQYYIYRDGVKISEVDKATWTYLDGGLSLGIDYTYRVYAVDFAGNPSQHAQIILQTKELGDTQAPTTPDNFTGIAVEGGVNLTWDASTDNVGVTGYKMIRRIKGSTDVEEIALGEGILTYEDRGLLAETTYIYTIIAEDAAGNGSIEKIIEVTTLPLNIFNVIWRAQKNLKGSVMLGSDIQITAFGEKERDGFAKIKYKHWYDAEGNLLSTPIQAEMEIMLTEKPDSQGKPTGVYEGVFPMQEGMAEILTITGGLKDSAANSYEKTSLTSPGCITGNLLVEIKFPEDMPPLMPGKVRVDVWSSQTGFGEAKEIATFEPLLIEGLDPAEDYEARLLINRLTLESKKEVCIKNGMIQKIVMHPKGNASLSVTLIDSDKSIIKGVKVDLCTMEGEIIASGETDASGRVISDWSQNTSKMFPQLFGEERVLIKTRFTEEQKEKYEDTQQMVYLRCRENQIYLLAQGYNRGTLRVQATDQTQHPVGYFNITAIRKDVDSSDSIIQKSFREVSSSDLHEIHLPQGHYDIWVWKENYEQMSLQDVDIQADTTSSLDVVLKKLPVLELRYSIEAEDGTISGLSEHDVFTDIEITNKRTGKTEILSVPRKKLWLQPAGVEPGDVLRISCVDNNEAYGFDPLEVSFSSSLFAYAHLTFYIKGNIRANIVDEEGKTRIGENRGLVIFKQENGEFYQYAVSRNTDIETTFTREGTYTAIMQFGNPEEMLSINSGGNTENPYLKGLTKWEKFLENEGIPYVKLENIEVHKGSIKDLSPEQSIVVPYYQAQKNKVFLSEYGNVLISNKQTALPGETITLKAAYYYAKKNAEYPENIRFELGVPEHTQLIPESVIAIEESAGIQPTVSLEGNTRIQVVLGDILKEKDEIKGKIIYQVKIDEDIEEPMVVAGAWVSYQMDGDKREEMGTTKTYINKLTLTAPEYATTHQIEIFGNSIPHSLVKVYDNFNFVGETTTSKYGVWTMKIHLTNVGDPSVHYLTAETQREEEILRSPVQRVYYDSKRPVVDWISIFSDDGYRNSGRIDCVDGVAVFPYTVVPGHKANIAIRFTDNSKVANVKVYFGNDAARMESPYAIFNDEEDVFETYLLFGYHMPGDIYISYDIINHSFNPIPTPEEEELTNTMPYPFSNAEIDILNMPEGDSEDGEVKDFEFQVTTAGSQHKIDMKLDIRYVENYDKQGADKIYIDENYGPIYDLEVLLEEREGNAYFEISAVVPQSLLDTYNNATRMGSQANGMDILVKLAGKSPLAAGLSIADLYGILGAVPAFEEKMQRIQDMKDFVNENCEGEGSKIVYNGNADFLRDIALKQALVQQGFNLAALGASKIPGFGIKATVTTWALGNLLGMGQDYKWEKLYNKYKNEISKNEDCKDEDGNSFPDHKPKKDKDDKKGGKRIASPKWIMDPSGFVYEAIEDNRVPGVTTTLLELNSETGEWEVWKAEAYLQRNPLSTDAEGKYAWDVPVGLWKVRFEKEGYEIAYSDELQVPPPQLDVNIPMYSYVAPQVEKVVAVNEYIEITFDKYMKTDFMTHNLIKVYAQGMEDETPGSIEIVDPKQNPQNPDENYCKTVRFVPESTFEKDDIYRLYLNKMLRSYANRTMDEDYDTLVAITTVQPVDKEAPGNVENIAVEEGYTQLSFSWEEPSAVDHSKTKIYWRKSGVPFYQFSDTVNQGTTSYAIYNLEKNTMYDVKITTLDEKGNESNGVVIYIKTKCNTCGKPVGDDEGTQTGGTQTGGNQGTPSTNTGNDQTEPGVEEKPTEDVPSVPDTGEEEPGYWLMGRQKQEIKALEDKVILSVEENTFEQEMKVYIEESDEEAELDDDAFMPMGKMLKINFEEEPQRPVFIDIEFQKSLLHEIDARKLGIYRQHDQDASKWHYVGGVLNIRDVRMEAYIKESGTYVIMAYQREFTDMQNHWARELVEILASRHVVHGKTSDEYDPDHFVTRAEFATLLVRMLQGEKDVGKEILNTKRGHFSDVEDNAWYQENVEKAASLGLVVGYNGYFRPKDAVNREEMALMTLRMLKYLGKNTSHGFESIAYEDESQISGWALEAVQQLQYYGIMNGMENQRFAPRENTTRSQAAAVIYRIMENTASISKVRHITGTVKKSDENTYLLEFYCPRVEKVICLKMNFASRIQKEKIKSCEEQEVVVEAILQMENESTIFEAELLVLQYH